EWRHLLPACGKRHGLAGPTAPPRLFLEEPSAIRRPPSGKHLGAWRLVVDIQEPLGRAGAIASSKIEAAACLARRVGDRSAVRRPQRSLVRTGFEGNAAERLALIRPHPDLTLVTDVAVS